MNFSKSYFLQHVCQKIDIPLIWHSLHILIHEIIYGNHDIATRPNYFRIAMLSY